MCIALSTGLNMLKSMELLEYMQYRPGKALRLKDMDDYEKKDYPAYGKLQEIIVWENAKHFVVTLLTT